MGKSRRVFTREFKVAAVNELKSGKPLGSVARRLEVNPNTLHRWRRELKRQPTKAFSGLGKRMLAETREGELEQKIGQLTMENDFLSTTGSLSALALSLLILLLYPTSRIDSVVADRSVA